MIFSSMYQIILNYFLSDLDYNTMNSKIDQYNHRLENLPEINIHTEEEIKKYESLISDQSTHWITKQVKSRSKILRSKQCNLSF